MLVGICLMVLTTFAVKAGNLELSISGVYSPLRQYLSQDKPSQQWGVMASGKLRPAKDLLLSFSQSLKFKSLADLDFTIRATIMYKFLVDPNLEAYAGLGYQILKTKFQSNLDEYNVSTGNFILATQADFLLTDKADIIVIIHGNPWCTWNYNKGTGEGAYYYYQLLLNYKFDHEWSVHAGYLGNTASMKIAEVEDKLGFASGGLTIGISHKF